MRIYDYYLETVGSRLRAPEAILRALTDGERFEGVQHCPKARGRGSDRIASKRAHPWSRLQIDNFTNLRTPGTFAFRSPFGFSFRFTRHSWTTTLFLSLQYMRRAH